jgi:hypothetical protein
LYGSPGKLSKWPAGSAPTCRGQETSVPANGPLYFANRNGKDFACVTQENYNVCNYSVGFIHRINVFKPQRFGSWFCFHLQVTTARTEICPVELSSVILWFKNHYGG